MELPELFGSPYILPAIVVVVVLLLVLVLLRLRARSKMAAKLREANGRVGRGAQAGPSNDRAAGTEQPAKPDKRALRAAAQAEKAERLSAAQAQKAEAQAARAAEKAARSGKARGRRGAGDAALTDLDTEMDYLTDELPEAEAAVFTVGAGTGGAAAGAGLGASGAAGLGAAGVGAAGVGAATGLDAVAAFYETTEQVPPGEVPPPPPWTGAPTDDASVPSPDDLFTSAPEAEPRSRSAQRGQPVARESVLPASDPVQMVVADILQGWGDIAVEDTNRLEVFRPERVMAAIAAAELPKDLKSSEYARTRLTQLRRYAAYVERGEEKPVVAPTPEHEFSGLAGEWINVSGPQGDSGLSAAASDAAGLAAGVGAGAAALATGAAAVAFDSDTPSAAPSAEPLAAEPADAAAKTGSAWETDVAEAHKSTEAAIAAAAAAFWARSDAPTPEQAAVHTEPAIPPIPVAPATPVIPVIPATPAIPAIPVIPATPVEPLMAEPVPTEPAVTPQPSPLDVWATSETEAPLPVTEKPVLQWEPVVERTVQPAALPEETTRLSDDYLEGLHGKISTAAGLMALPAADRKEMLVFLEPAELAKVFQAAEDSGLKKAVIDALEGIGTTSALDVIHACLDDPDPEVQIHALDAADRILSSG